MAHIDSGSYARQIEKGRVVEIHAGHSWCELGFEDAEDAVQARFLEDAVLAFPTTASAMVEWLGRQEGDVQLAMPGGDSLPTYLDEWIEAAEHQLAGRVSEHPNAADRKSSERKKLTRAEIAREGGKNGNAANRKVRGKIVEDYRTGSIESKNAAAAALAEKYHRTPGSVRNLLKGVNYEGNGGGG
ncbi:hypothetical protein LDO26_14510 [Luteimonas sp. BDR2-5]|uniref:hypothetical protein n=1 Tax=Proluteimonas luteida TaxID=2878685 RepID=UPI001E45E0DC|nr:hypothetical protein [Luteimonas sp. BDR2-5]MCD9029404.1 hypothetical protein [Luteimonas sp. BDR2-5]